MIILLQPKIKLELPTDSFSEQENRWTIIWPDWHFII